MKRGKKSRRKNPWLPGAAAGAVGAGFVFLRRRRKARATAQPELPEVHAATDG